MTLRDIRVALRSERLRLKRAAGLTLDRLQEASGIDRAAIHRIESVEKYPAYEPGMQTITRLVEGMGLTLSEFFLQIERQTDSDLPAGANERRSARTLSGKSSARGGHATSLPTDHDIRAAVGQALLRAAASLTDTAAVSAAESADREIPRARDKKRARR